MSPQLEEWINSKNATGRHYVVYSLDDLDNEQKWELLHILFDDQDNESGYEHNDNNWIFGGTSGIHGTYRKLESFVPIFESENHPEHYEDFTILIVFPRLVSCFCGTIQIRSIEDVEWMYDAIENSINGVIKSQEGNFKNEN